MNKTLILTMLIVINCQVALANEAPEIVYQVLSAESASEGQAGMDAVAVVMVNRAMGSIDSLERVVTKPKQFSAYNDQAWLNRWIRAYYTPDVRQRAQKAIERALTMEDRPAWTHYHTINVRPYWAKGHRGERVGQHVFYSGIK